MSSLSEKSKECEAAWRIKGAATAEARRRWGPDGFAWEGKLGIAKGRGPFRVGIWRAGEPVAYGDGPTYELAFRDADMRHPVKQVEG